MILGLLDKLFQQWYNLIDIINFGIINELSLVDLVSATVDTGGVSLVWLRFVCALCEVGVRQPTLWHPLFRCRISIMFCFVRKFKKMRETVVNVF